MEQINKLEHVYKPAWFIRSFTLLFDVASILFPIYVFVLVFTKPEIPKVFTTFAGIVSLIIFAAFTSLTLLIAANYYTEIVSDSEGLHLKFLWKRLTVKWDEIVDLKPLFNMPIFKNVSVVRTRSLTPFHRVYGLLYSFTFLPCIIFSKSISNYAELSKRIRESLRKAK